MSRVEGLMSKVKGRMSKRNVIFPTLDFGLYDFGLFMTFNAR